MRRIIIVLLVTLLMIPAFAQGFGEGIKANESVKTTADDPNGRSTALLNAFIENDPLNGDNGMETSPAAPLIYGPVNIAFDVDGNAIEALDEQDFIYANGYYYLIGQSFAEGAFNYAPGVPYNETLGTDIPTFYRWSGLVTYRSEDLENWTLVSRYYLQDPETGRHIVIKKPRICYSEATGKYVMWFLNNTKIGDEAPIMIMTADSPEGPWSEPFNPTVPEGIKYSDLTHDYQIKVDPETGIGWYTQAGTNTKLYKMTPEMTGVLEDCSFQMSGSGNFGTNTIAGGMGFFYHNGWWYITGTPQCGNCIGTMLSYVMARSPEGPWLSPDTMSDEQPLIPSLISVDGLFSQTHGAVTFPDGEGDTAVMIYGTHYRSSATGAPQEKLVFNNSGDNNLALSGQWWFTLEFDEDGRISMLEPKAAYEIKLAEPVTSEHAKAYQADLSVTKSRSVTQEWTVEKGTTVACVLPSVFQQTPDLSPSSNKWVAQDSLVNAPLIAKLDLPNGTSYTWTIDARSIAWGPRQVALNLPEAYTEGGKLVLTLSTKATNGGYGVALGVGEEGDVYSHVEGKNITTYEGQRIYVRTSATAASAPVITTQPVDITVTEGTTVGFLVQASGIGVGYQWYKDGSIVMPHGVTEGTRNESASAALRLGNVTMEDAGFYQAEAINAVGSVLSQTVKLTVLPKN
ncbi:MAG: family 43 glycosylhydrolase [Sphaerochaetaceae bacterium]|nr:family 43 glycosylhydrolase [Sphaerochaetaceae bacterium]